jgi:aldehyde:ferredoxin oxidoreductase
VNVREQTLKHEPIPETWKRLGGRGLLARILLDEVDATCDPLGPGNKLIFAPACWWGTCFPPPTGSRWAANPR